MALFHAKFACILAISNPVFRWESYKYESPKTQQYTMIIVCKKVWNAYKADMMWSSKDGVKKQTMAWSNKQSL